MHHLINTVIQYAASYIFGCCNDYSHQYCNLYSCYLLFCCCYCGLVFKFQIILVNHTVSKYSNLSPKNQNQNKHKPNNTKATLLLRNWPFLLASYKITIDIPYNVYNTVSTSKNNWFRPLYNCRLTTYKNFATKNRFQCGIQ